MQIKTLPGRGLLASLLATGLIACSAPGASQLPTTQAIANAPTAAVAAPPAPTTGLTDNALAAGVTGIGRVVAAQDADLVFTVQGTVEKVLVEEGDDVQAGQVLAMLDVRPFEQQIQQAEASLRVARAQRTSLLEGPKSADIRAANAQVEQAQAALNQVQAGPKAPDVQQSQAGLTAAQVNLESTRDKLSHAKTQAEIQVQQAAAALTQAQASYATAKSNWDRVQDTGKDPVNPSSVNPLTGKKADNKLSDAQRQQYYTQFVQAEAALRSAEDAVKQATLAAEGAREAEGTGVQAAEQQVTQAQAQLNKLLLPPDQSQLAAAQAALAGAQAQRAKLNPNPNGSQLEIASAGIAQAEAALAQAQLSREKAELKAPFSGVVSIVNIDPGDPSTTSGQPAIQVLDTSKLYVEVQISDVDIAKVQLNQAAKVQVDALDKELSGRVSYIAPQATENGNVRTYLVRVALDNQVENLRPGMSARVDIIPGQFVQPPTPTPAPAQNDAAAANGAATPACATVRVKGAVTQDTGASVNVRALNVRNAPDGAVVASLQPGEQAQRLAETQEQGGIVWVHIQLASGADGWVSQDYIEAACS